MPRNSKARNLIGKTFGRLTVVKEGGRSTGGNIRWICKCECGKEKEISSNYLKPDGSGTKSCGCLSIETHTTHNLSKHPLYQIYNGIKARCYYKNHIAYHNYGGRDIKICDEWLSDFKAFYDWAINNGWENGLQIDRKNNNKNYSPDNCRFVTNLKNCQNTRKSMIWVIEDKKYNSITEAAKAEEVSVFTIQRWCGRIANKNQPIKNKPGCYVINKYAGG